MARLLLSLLVLLLAQLATACYPVHFETQELRIRLDREQDLASFELTLRDLSLDSVVGEEPHPKRVQEAIEFLGRAARGERVFIVPPESDVVDLEQELLKSEEPLGPGEYERPARQAMLRGLRVVEARLELDDDGKLNLVQRVELAGLTEHLAAMNAEWRRVVLAESETERVKQSIAEDPRGPEALELADARAGHDRVLWDDEGLAVRIPMASEQHVQLLRSILSDGFLQDAKNTKDAFEAYTTARFSLSYVDYGLQLVRDLRVEPDHLTLYLGTPGGELTTSWHFGELVELARLVDSDEALVERDRAGLLEALEENGLSLPLRYAAED